MRIVFLCKRRYMGKDVIGDRYARLYEIPYQLARLGHSVLGISMGYQGQQQGRWQHEASPGRLVWEAYSIDALHAFRLLGYRRRLVARLKGFAPEVLIGASDIPQIALTAWLSKRLGTPYCVDLYDNFEGFGQARIPGAVRMLRSTVRRAALVTTTSEPLAELVRDGYRAQGKVVSMPSTIDKAIFRQLDRDDCRRKLGLPAKAKLVGTAGSLRKAKGVGALYAAWERLASRHPDLHLVLAGPVDKTFRPPNHERVHYLGQIPHADTALLFNALDVGVIYIRETKFGLYCFPQKAYEMMSCGLPIVAADVGAMHTLLESRPVCLYRPDDIDDLVLKLESQLRDPVTVAAAIDDWQQIVRSIEPHVRLTATRTVGAIG